MKNMNKMRCEQKITQQMVAKYLGVSQNTYSQYERKVRQPPISSIPKLAKVLRCSIEDIVFYFCDNSELEETIVLHK